ncbi:helix-turn-helix transcriptional regulator [Arthrobacter bambusae]|uniref:helix-turn-helix transcriptional regulator n=1 Tax=Arthrobacter TaxID=1663 RepID=UPI001F50981A|nr:helix-turn-helix transcriptional regulator [Arthrobacter bambusae]MCI0143024.1 helix-turn-helix transcriptional regulator [Arthrobacter bambusae]UKA64387.1 helix-turn-helix transcriptional regulator [Arthrobacter sp. FW306-04-A]
MNYSNDVREFLTTRRARITPAKAGLPTFAGTRRVAGLKREEVAMLAGMSTEYYARLERGNLRGVSEPVLESLASALQLDEAERTHLFNLARAAMAASRPARTRKPRTELRPSIEGVLRGMSGTPAYVRNARMDIVAANSLCFALYAGVLEPETLPVNLARFVFLDPRSHDFFVKWDSIADDLASSLRVRSGKSPTDSALKSLVGELITGSQDFATRWARHDVRFHRTARKVLRNPVVGEIELTGDSLELPGEDLTIVVYTAEPGSRDQEKLDFLASWSSDQRAAGKSGAADQSVESEARKSSQDH